MNTLLIGLLFGVVAAGMDPRVVTYQRQLLADVYQAMARAKLDANVAASVIHEFQQIRRGRADSGNG